MRFLRKKNKKNNNNKNSPAAAVSSDESSFGASDETISRDRDKWGIQKIYPDAQGDSFQVWYMDQDADPTKDKRFGNWKNANLRKMQDGSGACWYVDGKDQRGQVRLEGLSESGTKKWLDAEATIYVFYIDDSKEFAVTPYVYTLYLRGGKHTAKDPCLGACYKAMVRKDRRVSIVKEVEHPQYTSNRVGKQIANEVKGSWIGFKLIVYNFQEDPDLNTYVKIEVWIDENCTDEQQNLVIRNKWYKAAETIDRGGWAAKEMIQASDCPALDLNSKTLSKRQPDEIISMPGGTNEYNVGCFRTDGVMVKFKNFSIRAIQSPRVN
jgi:hypothetical protein